MRSATTSLVVCQEQRIQKNLYLEGFRANTNMRTSGSKALIKTVAFGDGWEGHILIPFRNFFFLSFPFFLFWPCLQHTEIPGPGTQAAAVTTLDP